MEKPTYPEIVLITPAEIRAIRKGLRVTQEQFGRYFPVSKYTVSSWESDGNRSRPYGPCNVRLQELKAWVDHLQADRKAAEARFLGGRRAGLV